MSEHLELIENGLTLTISDAYFGYDIETHHETGESEYVHNQVVHVRSNLDIYQFLQTLTQECVEKYTQTAPFEYEIRLYHAQQELDTEEAKTILLNDVSLLKQVLSQRDTVNYIEANAKQADAEHIQNVFKIAIMIGFIKTAEVVNLPNDFRLAVTKKKTKML